jgi:HD-GYP domain-containing protein (c-di-GMP phosphodiesterase class II)
MTDGQTLLKRIAALRQQLEDTQGAGLQTSSANEPAEAARIRRLEQQISLGSEEISLLNSSLRQLSPTAPIVDATALPKQFTSRARQALEHSRRLLDRLRRLADEFSSGSTGEDASTSAADESSPFTNRYNETTAMVELVLRMIQAFPDSPTAQLRLCEGIEAILQVVDDRVAVLEQAANARRQQESTLSTLAEFLTLLYSGTSVEMATVNGIVASILANAQNGAPFRFLTASAQEPARFIAAHSLNVAHVAARVSRHDPDFRKDPHQPILAALLHDIGMLHVPAVTLSSQAALDDGERRTIEAHPRIGAEILARALPSASWLAETAAGHHERLDGTGYPDGLREYQLTSLTRFISVCDVYAALATPRPHRAALDTRTALADTLLLAEKGLLDRYHAERLLQLSFYPVGSVVELADGAIGVVVATHAGRRDLNAPARPVLTLLTDTERRPFPAPQYLDLGVCENRNIIRALKQGERGDVLGKRYPEFA